MGRIKRIFEDFFLFSLVILNILDFIEWLPEDFDFLKKIISWTMMIYLLYHLGFSNILVGYKERKIDFTLLIAYTLFIIKDLFFYIMHADFQMEIFENIVIFLRMNHDFIDFWSFNISAILILILSILLVYVFRIEEKSMLGALTLDRRHGIVKFLGNLLSISFIAYFIFMMVFQWFTIVIDAPLVMIAIVYSLFALKRYHGIEGMLYKVADFGENILEKFIKLFHDRSTLPIGLISLLVLHFFTDLFVFIVPTLISIKDSLYYNALGGAKYTTLISLFLENIKGMDVFSIVNLSVVYLCNLCFVFILFIVPLLILRDIYRNRKIDLHPLDNRLTLSISLIYFLFPIYRFFKIEGTSAEISGVNIIMHKIQHTILLDYAAIIFIISFFILFLFTILKKIDLTNISLIVIMVPISDYVIKYFNSRISYQIESIKMILSLDYLFIILFLFIFLLLIILFYIPSLVLMAYEIFKLNHIHLLPDHIEHKKVHDLMTALIYFLLMYLIITFVSTIFNVFDIKSLFDFFVPIILSFMLIMLPNYSVFFPRIKLFNNGSDKFFAPISMIIGLVFSSFFIFFREITVFNTNNMTLLITSLVFVAISEEILFRHYLQHYLSSIFSFRKSMLFQSFIFTFMHVGNNFIILGGIFVFSIAITILKEKKGLFNAITLHFFTNLITYSYLLGIL